MPARLAPAAIASCFISFFASSPMNVSTSVPSIAFVCLKSISTSALRPKLRAGFAFVTTPSPGRPFAKTSLLSTMTSAATLYLTVSPTLMFFVFTGVTSAILTSVFAGT